MKTERNRLHLLQKSRRMFKAKIGQVRDRGPVAVTLEIAAKPMSRSGLRPAPSQAADAFDAEYGTDTRGIVQPWNLTSPTIWLAKRINMGPQAPEPSLSCWRAWISSMNTICLQILDLARVAHF